MTSPPTVGQEAPDFTLKGPAHQRVSLSEYRGRKSVVLAFFPLAFSPVCSVQLPAIMERQREIEALGAAILGISVDSAYANEAFANQLDVSFPLLSDFDRAVSKAYGVLLTQHGTSARALFVIDRGGRIAYREVSPATMDVGQIPRIEGVLDTLRALAAEGRA